MCEQQECPFHVASNAYEEIAGFDVFTEVALISVVE
jgi:hypothetical protein